MTHLLVAHGTRNRAGIAMLERLSEAVAAQLQAPVRIAYVDVLGPTPAQVLDSADLADAEVTVVPAFLSAGYHVREDLPRKIASSGHAHVQVTPALGPSRAITRILVQRLVAAGWRPGDATVLCAAGSSDDAALGQVRVAAAMLSATLGSRVEIGYIVTASPDVAGAVAGLREQGQRRIFLASYLLADGLFQRRLGQIEGV